MTWFSTKNKRNGKRSEMYEERKTNKMQQLDVYY